MLKGRDEHPEGRDAQEKYVAGGMELPLGVPPYQELYLFSNWNPVLSSCYGDFITQAQLIKSLAIAN